MRRLWAILLLAGCSVPGPVAQLQRFEAAEASGDTASVATAAMDSDCDGRPGQSAACAKLQAAHGRACLAQARNAAAPNAACPPSSERPHLQCAAAGFAAALQAGFTPADPGSFAENHARALYCLANLGADAEGVTLSRQSLSLLAAVPAEPGRDLLAASSALHIARTAGAEPSQRCAAASEASRLAERGLAAAPPGPLADGLRSVRFNAAAAAQGVPGCGGG